MMHPDLERLLAEVDAAETDARALAANLSDAQGNWRPGDGWSVVQCLDHLARTNHLYTSHFMQLVERATARGGGSGAGLRLTRAGRWFVRSLEPPPRQKTRTFKRVAPSTKMTVAAALAAYVGSHAPYRRLVTAANVVDVNRLSARNPFLPLLRFRVSTALCVIPAHDRRHLWQARQVLAAPGFPPAPGGGPGRAAEDAV